MNLQELSVNAGNDSGYMEIRRSSSEGAIVSGSNDGDAESGLQICTFRPSWWMDNDPITGRPVISE
jgi:hypothetical protein